MGLLKPAVNQTAAAKIGIYGEAGSGKTRTATEIALGLAQLAKAPIAFFDTEGGSDFMIPVCDRAGIQLLVAKRRAFADLMEFMDEAREAGAVIIIDSISHTWDDLRESYERKLKRTKGLEIWDWGKIKPEWRRFTNEFLASPCHAIVCGRAAAIYEQVYNAEREKNEMQVTGARMKTEKETGYEPSLLIEMERVPRREAAGWDHVATVVKDRSDTMDGMTFTDPSFETFRPFFAFLNIGGEHKPTEIGGDSQHLFDSPDSAIRRKKAVEIALEEIKEAFVLADCSGTSKDDRKKQTNALIAGFGTSAWSKIEDMRLEQLQAGLTKVRQALGLTSVPLTNEETEQLDHELNAAVRSETITEEHRRLIVADLINGKWDNVRSAWEAVRHLVLEKAEPPQSSAA